MKKKQTVLRVFWILTISLNFCEKGIADDWSLSLYGGVLLKGNLSDGSLLYSGFEDSYLVALALAKRVASYKDKIDLELEGQTVKHFKDQDHWEFNIRRVHLVWSCGWRWDLFGQQQPDNCQLHDYRQRRLGRRGRNKVLL